MLLYLYKTLPYVRSDKLVLTGSLNRVTGGFSVSLTYRAPRPWSLAALVLIYFNNCSQRGPFVHFLRKYKKMVLLPLHQVLFLSWLLEVETVLSEFLSSIVQILVPHFDTSKIFIVQEEDKVNNDNCYSWRHVLLLYIPFIDCLLAFPCYPPPPHTHTHLTLLPAQTVLSR